MRIIICFAKTQWELFEKESPHRVKPLLYVYRVLLTGIWLMRTGEIEANLATLNEVFHLPEVDDLIAQKQAGPEQSTLESPAIDTYFAAFEHLLAELEAEHQKSSLREAPEPSSRAALDDLLLRVRTCPRRI